MTIGCDEYQVKLDEEVSSPVPYKYFPISFNDSSIELLGRLTCEVPITLIDHRTGSVFHTQTMRTGYRVGDYQGRYPYTALASQPTFNLVGNFLRDVTAVTAFVGQPNGPVRIIEPIEIEDKDLAKKIDFKVREEGYLDSILGKRTDINRDLGYHKYLENQVPRIFDIPLDNQNVTLISYNYNDEEVSTKYGPRLLLLNEKLYDFWGTCSDMPYFYTIGQQLYARILSSQCESGYIEVGNFVVFPDSLVYEWSTLDYAN